MTEEQGKIIQELKKKHGIQDNTPAYFLMLLGVGCSMNQGEIEAYLFQNPKENMIEKDMRRVCMFLDIAIPEETEPGQALQKKVLDWKQSEKELKRYQDFFAKQGVSFKEAEQSDTVRVLLNPGEEVPEEAVLEPGIQEPVPEQPYGMLLSVIMKDKRFSPGQLEQIIKAVEHSIPEKEILKFANPDIEVEKMARYIEFYLLDFSPEKKKVSWWKKKGEK